MNLLKVSDRSTQLAVIGLSAAALVVWLLYVPGVLAGLAACGTIVPLPSPFGPLSVLNPLHLGDMSGFGATATGCHPDAAMTIGIAVTLMVGTIVVIIAIARLVSQVRQSEERLVRDLMARPGLAKRAEIARTVGPRQLLSRAGTIRPTVTNAAATDAGWNIGDAVKTPVFISVEDSVVLVGPPRAGKGFFIIVNAILDAPGAVITTSTRGDNYAATAALRARKGPVSLFDPQGLTGMASTLKWSPITGCDRPQVAERRAASLIDSSGLGQSSNNQEWAVAAKAILRSLLHAAALGGRTVDDLYLWSAAPVRAHEAVEILLSDPRAAAGWGPSLQAVLEGQPDMLQNRWFGVENALNGLAVPVVRETLKPASPEDQLVPSQFIRDRGTLYLIGTKTGGGAMAPFLVALMDEITETGREMAIRLPGNRLDPPMGLVLDEIANLTSAWPGLVTLMSDGGGVGISTMVVLQSLAQARGKWGAEDAQAVFDAATIKIQLGGSGNADDLQMFSTLTGVRDVAVQTLNESVDGRSVSVSAQERAIIRVDELRRLPFGYGLYFSRSSRPFLLKMTRWTDRPDAKEIRASIASFNASLAEQLVSTEHKSLAVVD